MFFNVWVEYRRECPMECPGGGMRTFQSHHLRHSWFSVLCRSRLFQSWIFRLRTVGIASRADRPHFHCTSCRSEDGRRSHWTGHGPAGAPDARSSSLTIHRRSLCLGDLQPRRFWTPNELTRPVAFVNWHHSTRRP